MNYVPSVPNEKNVDKVLRTAVIRGFDEISKRLDRSLAQGDEIIALLKRLDEEVEQPQPIEVTEPVKTDGHGTLEG
jgi:hypothetical protein